MGDVCTCYLQKCVDGQAYRRIRLEWVVYPVFVPTTVLRQHFVRRVQLVGARGERLGKGKMVAATESFGSRRLERRAGAAGVDAAGILEPV